MFKMQLSKMEYSGIGCNHPECKHLPKYHDNIIGNQFFIKIGTPYLSVLLKSNIEYYCKDCIDKLYESLKPMLNSKLWLFT